VLAVVLLGISFSGTQALIVLIVVIAIVGAVLLLTRRR
jgi:hypothetical protein